MFVEVEVDIVSSYNGNNNSLNSVTKMIIFIMFSLLEL